MRHGPRYRRRRPLLCGVTWATHGTPASGKMLGTWCEHGCTSTAHREVQGEILKVYKRPGVEEGLLSGEKASTRH